MAGCKYYECTNKCIAHCTCDCNKWFSIQNIGAQSHYSNKIMNISRQDWYPHSLNSLCNLKIIPTGLTLTYQLWYIIIVSFPLLKIEYRIVVQFKLFWWRRILINKNKICLFIVMFTSVILHPLCSFYGDLRSSCIALKYLISFFSSVLIQIYFQWNSSINKKKSMFLLMSKLFRHSFVCPSYIKHAKSSLWVFFDPVPCMGLLNEFLGPSSAGFSL